MTKTPLWTSIAATLVEEICHGFYAPGAKLPTEAELARRFAVNRHTVRRALADLAERGLVRARRGAGVFVEAAPTDYPLGKRVRFHQNIRAGGRIPDKRRLRLERRTASAPEARLLNLPPSTQVLVYEGLSLSGRIPVAHFVSVFPVTRLPALEQALRDTTSVTQAMAQSGVADFLRKETRIGAELASTARGQLLNLPEGAPLLKTTAVNAAPDGTPVEFGTTWFAADRVTLTVPGQPS